MINFQYLRAELFRRRAKTVLISIGLAVPIALTIVVGAYSTGLSNAQDEVLEPLVGLGTDMTVTKTADAGEQGGGGPPRIAFSGRDAGESFSEDRFTTGANAVFDDSELSEISKLNGVTEASGALTVTNLKVSGEIPEQSASPGAAPGAGGVGPGGPQSIDIDTKTVTGLTPGSELGPISADQLQEGTLLSSGDAAEAVITSGYAETNNLSLGDTVSLKDDDFKVVGIVSTPLAGASSDVYVKLDQLQEAADMKGDLNTAYVRATSQEAVQSVSTEVKGVMSGATVTTNASLADEVSGSLVNANNLVDKMGVFLVLVLLLAAVIITAILTLNAVNKRTREFGTLKSIGWSNPRLVRQVMGESLATGTIGAASGVLLGLLAMAIAKLTPLTMQINGATQPGLGQRLGISGPPGGGAPGGDTMVGGPPGLGSQATEAAVQTISIVPTLSPSTIVVAAAIGAATALIAGGLGALKTSKLSPVEAMKHVD